MANYQSTHTGTEIDAGIDLLDKNSATAGQVLTANGTGGASWQNASGSGGSSGTSIGGGFTIKTQWDGAISTSNFLILGKRVIDGVYGFHNYNAEKSNIGDDYNFPIPIYTNVSIIIPLDWCGSSFYIDDYSALKAYDGTVLTSSNRDNYVNKICYLVKDCVFHEYD